MENQPADLRILGTDPTTGHTISITPTRYAIKTHQSKPYEKAKLLRKQNWATVTLPEVLDLFVTERTLGTYPATGEIIKLFLTIDGPMLYLPNSAKGVHVPPGRATDITLEEAIPLLDQWRPAGLIAHAGWDALRYAIENEPVMADHFKTFCELLYEFEVPIYSPGGSEIRRLLQVLTIPHRQLASTRELMNLIRSKRGKAVISKFIDRAEAQGTDTRRSRTSRKYPRDITPDQASEAIYIDFEGGIDMPPSLVGLLIEGCYTPVLLNPAFKHLALTKQYKYQSFPQFVADTLALARRENRMIIAWTEHEWDIMSEFDDGTLGTHYRNANLLVKDFFKNRRNNSLKKMNMQIKADYKNSKRRTNKAGLKDYLVLEYINYDYPRDLKSFSPSKAITWMEKQLKAKENNYAKVSKGAKRAFTNLVRYNEHDCRGAAFMVDYII